jgi:hypothetical protein
LKRAIAVAVLIGVSVFAVSCGSYNSNGSSSSSSSNTSGLTFRAFVSNPLSPANGGGGAAALNIIDASKDVVARQRINLSGSILQAGRMSVSPDKKFTMVYSPSSNSIALVDNTAETVVAAGNSSLPAVTLPGPSESMFVSKFNTQAFAAVPTASVLGQSPGAVIRIALANAAINANIPIPAVRFIVESNNGNSILAMADNSNVVSVISTSLIGTPNPITSICCFDHPVWGVYSGDDSTAYVLNCGPECGGTAASISVVDLATHTVTGNIPVAAATKGLISGSTLYVAGTAPGTTCAAGTVATNCGTLTIINLGTLAVTGTASITDGYHDRMELANGQVFIGGRNCTNLTDPAVEIRGCLTIFNSSNGKVVVPPDNGDVTGIQPITNRNVVYVCEGGNLRIYDTTTDALQSKQVDIIGQAIDVKLVD